MVRYRMGNIFSQNQRELIALENRLKNTEHKLANLQHLDQDQDGFVSKAEYQSWIVKQNEIIQDFKNDMFL